MKSIVAVCILTLSLILAGIVFGGENEIYLPAEIEITGIGSETGNIPGTVSDAVLPRAYTTDDTIVEVFGNTSSRWSGGNRDRGNIFQVNNTVNLWEHRFYLESTGNMSVCFIIFQGASGPTGSFNLVDSVTVTVTPGSQMFASGERNFELQAGSFYYIGASWGDQAGYSRGGPTPPIACSFGTLMTGIPGNICGGFPPGSVATNSYTNFQGYHAEIVTGIVANVMITLTPINPPIIVPNGGGLFSFNAFLENSIPNTVSFDVWSEVILPNGAVYGPILRRDGLSLPIGGTASRTLNQMVPWNAPPGVYYYVGKVGDYQDSVWHHDEFEFTKMLDESESTRFEGWKIYGWDEDEKSQITNHNSQFSILNSQFLPQSLQRFNSSQLQAKSCDLCKNGSLRYHRAGSVHPGRRI